MQYGRINFQILSDGEIHKTQLEGFERALHIRLGSLLHEMAEGFNLKIGEIIVDTDVKYCDALHRPESPAEHS